MTQARRGADRRRLGAVTAMVEALPIWLASRCAVAVAALGGIWVIQGREARDVASWLEVWQHWDADLFVKVAEHGYPPTTAYADRTEVDFPMMPLLLRFVYFFTGNWTASGLIISLVAGGVAACALYHLAASEWDFAAGRRAVLYLVTFPYAVFLFAGYSEAVFLAFATTSWVYARQARWGPAGLLAAGAAFTRVLGLCLAAGLAVEYVVWAWQRGGLREVVRPRILWLGAPLVSVAAHVTYLWSRTGMWDAYQDAQRDNWNRYTAPIQEGLRTMWRLANHADQPGEYAWSWRAEMLAVLGGMLIALVLLALRRWGEATYVGTSAVLLAAQNYYASSVRAALVWFPIYLLLARVTIRREWLHYFVVGATAPLMVVFVLVFNEGRWVG